MRHTRRSSILRRHRALRVSLYERRKRIRSLYLFYTHHTSRLDTPIRVRIQKTRIRYILARRGTYYHNDNSDRQLRTLGAFWFCRGWSCWASCNDRRNRR